MGNRDWSVRYSDKVTAHLDLLAVVLDGVWCVGYRHWGVKYSDRVTAHLDLLVVVLDGRDFADLEEICFGDA